MILWTKLSADGRFKDFDVFIASMFVAAVSGFVVGLKKLGRGACTAPSLIRQGIANLYNN